MNRTEKQRLKQQELVAHSLSQILAIFAEMLSKNMAAEIIPVLPDLSQIQIPEPVSLGPLEVLVKNSGYKVDALKKQLDILGTHHQLLDQANETNKLLGTQFYGDHIIEPMVRSLFPLCDLIDSAKEKLAPATRKTSLKNLEAIETQLTQFLAGYGINSIALVAQYLDGGQC